MNSEEQICQEALRLLRELRTDYLTRACEGDEEFRARVEEMLRAVAERTAGEDPSEVTLEESGPVTEGPGSVIGRYKLLQPIGEGGFGAVYMAEQTAPVVRRVALKIIKLGMDTKQVIARFEAERQALALMDHPNIAKVFDAGSTTTGRPYFVMELVRGIPITEFCDKNRLSARQRLELVIPVCDAIQHAHHKGIIHRDIKPSNILVTLHDGAPLPMVIDFGIAKATNQRLTEKTLFTDFAQMIGTPAYMSPEQAEMSKLDVDTRTDVYSLGVLLYELLTGTTPFSSRELLEGGYGAMQRIIAEQEPPRPSTRLNTMAPEQKTTVARNRGNDLSDLGARLRGDLDWIVMKCLEKERGRRYETASALAADLQRHLQSEPVVARPPSLTYRLQKAVRRNRLAFAAAGAVAVALVLGLAAASWQAVQARREALRAQQAEALASQRLAESEAVAKFMTEAFRSLDPMRDGRTITVAESLELAAKRLDEELASQPALQVRLQAEIAMTYSGLGLDQAASQLQEKVRDYYLASSGPGHPDTLQAMHNLANSYHRLGRQPEALELREKVLTNYRELLGENHPRTLVAMQNLAVSFDEMGRHADAQFLRETLVELWLELTGPEHPNTLSAMHSLAHSYWNMGRHVEERELHEKVLMLRRKVLGSGHQQTLQAMECLASSYSRDGRLAEALALRQEVLALRREGLGLEHPRTLNAMLNLASSHAAMGHVAQALEAREEVLSLHRKVLGPEHPQTLSAMAALMESYLDVSRNVEAIELGEETLAMYRKVYGHEHPWTINPMDHLASSYSGANRHGEAISMGKEVLALREKVYGRRHPSTLSAMNNLSLLYIDAAQPEEAVMVLEEALALSRDVNGQEHPRTLRVMSNLANGYRLIGRLEEAIDLGKETLALRAKVLGESNPETRRTMQNLVLSYWAAEQRVEAVELQERLVALCREVLGVAHSTTLEELSYLAHYYDFMGQREQALAVQEEVLSIQRELYGQDHPMVFRSMRSLLHLYRAADRVGDALNLQNEITAVRISRFANAMQAHPRLAYVPSEILDLSEFFNADLTEDWHNFDDLGNNLASLPRGLQTFGGVTFEVRAIVQLSSTNLAALQPEYPDQVTGIRAGQQAASLHFLHGTGWPLHDDSGADVVTEIGRYLVHYSDGQTAEIPIRYGEHVRNWQFWPEGEAREHGGAAPVWKGPQARWQAVWPNTGVRLYHTSWENPRPDAVISSIDFISTMTGSAPFLLAITVQPPVLAGVTPSQ